MSKRPDMSNLINQIAVLQNKAARKEMMAALKLQPYDVFLRQEKITEKPFNNCTFQEAFRIMKCYQLYPENVSLRMRIKNPEYFKFPKDKWLPVDKDIVRSSKSPIVMAFALGDELEKCREAGADYCGGYELIDKIKDYGMIKVDDCFADVNILPSLSRIVQLLASNMPNTRRGTANDEISKYIKIYKKWNYIELEREMIVEQETNNNDETFVESIEHQPKKVIRSKFLWKYDPEHRRYNSIYDKWQKSIRAKQEMAGEIDPENDEEENSKKKKEKIKKVEKPTFIPVVSVDAGNIHDLKEFDDLHRLFMHLIRQVKKCIAQQSQAQFSSKVYVADLVDTIEIRSPHCPVLTIDPSSEKQAIF